MSSTRRNFVRQVAMASMAGGIMSGQVQYHNPVIKPRRLQKGDTVGLVAPATRIYEPVQIEIVEESLAVLGLKTQRGDHVLGQHVYFAGYRRATGMGHQCHVCGIRYRRCFCIKWWLGRSTNTPFTQFRNDSG